MPITVERESPVKTIRVAKYLRQSIDVLDDRLAIARQEADIDRMLATIPNHEIVEVYVDNDASATNGKPRKDFLRMQADARAGKFDVLACQVIDRLLRSMRELEDLVDLTDQTGVVIKAANGGEYDLGTPSGRLVARMLAAAARGEIEVKSARQRLAARQAAEMGKPPARRAFGYTDTNEIDPTEGPALASLYDKVLAGMTIRGATAWLNEQGYVTTTGRRWERSGTRTMLVNPRNAGLRSYNREIVGPGQWEPVVSPEIWQAVIDMLADPSRRSGHASNNRKWLGVGLYLCGRCGAPMVTKYSDRGNVRRYTCSTATHMTRTGQPLDDLVDSFMVAYLSQVDLAERLAPTKDGKTIELRTETKKLRLRLAQIEKDYAEAEPPMSYARFVRLTTPIEKRLAAATDALAKVIATTAIAEAASATDPVRHWRDADVVTKQSILNAVVTVTVLPAPRGKTTFDPDTIRIAPKV